MHEKALKGLEYGVQKADKEYGEIYIPLIFP